MKFQVVNQTKEKKYQVYKPILKQIVKKIERELNLKKRYNFSLILVQDEVIQKINKEYRNKNQTTDVISFASMDTIEAFEEQLEEMEIGDIFINLDAVERQSKEYGHTIEREYCFLFTHGVLHLLGYDHMNEIDEKKMFALQEVILHGICER